MQCPVMLRLVLRDSGTYSMASGNGGANAQFSLSLIARLVNCATDMTCLTMQCPVVLRLVFHDSSTYNMAAGNGGANASIQHELERPENFGLRRAWKVIQQAMLNIQGTAAEGVISYADMIALVGAYAVGLCGGPLISIPIGELLPLVLTRTTRGSWPTSCKCHS